MMNKILLLPAIFLVGCASHELRVAEYRASSEAVVDGVELIGCRVVSDGTLPEDLTLTFTSEHCTVTLP